MPRLAHLLPAQRAPDLPARPAPGLAARIARALAGPLGAGGPPPPRPLEVVVATRSVAPLVALAQAGVSHRVREATTTRGVYGQLAGAHLVVVDLEGPDRVAEHGLTRAALRTLLDQQALVWCGGGAFAAEPRRFLDEALQASGALETLPPRVVCLTSFAGGVGSTTAALDTAALFWRRTRLPVGAVEFCHGVSAVRVLAAAELPGLFDVVNRSRRRDPDELAPPAAQTEAAAASAAGRWRGVDLVPMDWATASLLDPPELNAWFQGGDAFPGFTREHVLTLIDCRLPHALFAASQLASLVDHFLVLATPRPDADRQAQALAAELRSAYPRARVGVVSNQRRRLDRLAGAGACDVAVPYHERAELLEGHLGRYLLAAIYPRVRLDG